MRWVAILFCHAIEFRLSHQRNAFRKNLWSVSGPLDHSSLPKTGMTFLLQFGDLFLVFHAVVTLLNALGGGSEKNAQTEPLHIIADRSVLVGFRHFYGI
jgi:hypothetical protein